MTNGKGSKRRPIGISQEKYYENWDKIFKKKRRKTKTKTKKNNRED